MQRTSSFVLAFLTLLTPAAVLLCLPSAPVSAQTAAAPSLMNFQGRLATPSGNPVPDGNYSIRFSLWSAASGGTERWSQTINPTAVKNGTFAVVLNVGSGFLNGATAATLFNNNLWLEIKIGTAAALAPRQQLVSIPYALKANTVPDGSITGAKIANGTITADKLVGGGLAPAGAAGGDLIGNYPNPELRTVASSLYKVSGTIMSALTGGAGGVDLIQNVVNAQNQDEAWQSFTPSQSGNLTAIELYIGTTTGANRTIPLTVYAGEGIGGSVLGSVNATVTPTMGFQNFSLAQPIPVVAGQKYTYYIGRSSSLQFGYSNADPYTGGKADIGATLDYAFRTYMNSGANARIAVNGDFTTTGRIGIGTTNFLDRLTVSGAGTAITTVDDTVRTRLFSAAGPGRGYVGTSTAHGFTLRTGDADRVTISAVGNVGIGTVTPESQLHLTGDLLFNNGRIIQAKNAAGTNEPFLWPRWTDNITYMNFGVGGLNLRNNASDSKLFIRNDGNVGIGDTNPGSKLTVNGNITAGGPLILLNGSDLNLNGNGDDPGDLVFRNSAGAQLSRIYTVADGRIFLSPRGDSDVRALVHNGGMSVIGNMAIQDSGNSGIMFSGNGEVSGDTGIGHQQDGLVGFITDGAYRMYSFQNQNYMTASATNIYNRLNVNAGDQFYIYGLPDLGDHRNVQWNPSTGRLSQDNSTRRDKRDIQSLTEKEDVMKLLQAEAKVYTRPWDRSRWELGFIAEDLDALGLNRLVWYGQDGKTPESLNYTKMVVYLTEIAKIQQKQIEAQKQKIATLEKKGEDVEALKAQMETLMQRLERLEADRK